MKKSLIKMTVLIIVGVMTFGFISLADEKRISLNEAKEHLKKFEKEETNSAGKNLKYAFHFLPRKN